MNVVKPTPKNRKDKAIIAAVQSDTLDSLNLLRMEYGMPVDADNCGTKVDIKDLLHDKRNGVLRKALHTVAVAGYVYPSYHFPDSGDPKGYEHNSDGTIKKDVEGSPIIREKIDPVIDRPHANMNSIMHSHWGIAAGVGLMYLIGSSIAGRILEPSEDLLRQATSLAFPATYLLSSARTKIFTDVLGFPTMKYSQTLGHEHVHIMQAEFDMKRSLDVDYAEPSDEYDIFNAYLQTHIAKSAIDQSPFNKKAENYVRFIEGGLFKSDYFQEDCEIQARLHTVLTHRGSDLPQTKYQLWDALIDSGMIAPKEIRAQLEKSGYGTDRTLGQKLKTSFNRHADRDVSSLNFAYRAGLRPETKTFFWNVTLPYLYGHLLELYADQGFELGNKDGRKIMGFTKDMDLATQLPKSTMPWGVQKTRSTPTPKPNTQPADISNDI